MKQLLFLVLTMTLLSGQLTAQSGTIYYADGSTLNFSEFKDLVGNATKEKFSSRDGKMKINYENSTREVPFYKIKSIEVKTWKSLHSDYDAGSLKKKNNQSSILFSSSENLYSNNIQSQYKAEVTMKNNHSIKCYKFRLNKGFSAFRQETQPQLHGIIQIETQNGKESIPYNRIHKVQINYLDHELSTSYYYNAYYDVTIYLKSGNIRRGKISLYEICCYDSDDILIKIKHNNIKSFKLFY